MKKSARFAAALLAASILASGVVTHAAEPSADARALEQLARSGANLSKLHRVEFILLFPSEDDAAQAAAHLKELAFATATEHDEPQDKWVVLAAKVMYPVESDLATLREKLNAVAKESHGAYDGWRATPSNE